ncbi:ATPase domain-containing protein [Campylobacter vulpis]|uniref:ATPase domain-containing protein n=1 Tax=Campylobacter vulpis TaxID=1655500 RepID=UPI000C14DBAE|nr:ATPase domain-containing protein [Campylobacter vulpis]MBS4275594.1 hypothetical protein [Campylobacter vulpis]MBS4306823.1 hypothetical protein [Campylobacter vulpis]MBS4329931.1 hypothetical protein [Campylobacter vulpis]MBS4407593.1 hypothetical protein [Campylobacter vulpis]MBS4423578.1 hypothetical protein [Campylobacter vulpis]
MDTNINLEKELLRSFIEYPLKIDEFLDKTSLKVFSKSAIEYIQIILKLKEKGLLSLNVFSESVSEAQKKDGYFLDIISLSPNPLFCDLAPLLAHNYKIKKQGEMAQALNHASLNNELLDLSILSKEMDEANVEDLRTLDEWLKYYEDKPLMMKHSTSIDFIDNAFEGGFELAQLMLISGDAESGKTTLCLQMLEHLAIRNKVAFFSFEFTINSYLESVKKQNKKLPFDNFYIINDGYEISEVAANIKRLYKKGVRFFLIDSQMRLEVGSHHKITNIEQAESLKFSTLAKLCHSLEIFIMLIIQTSKSDPESPSGSKKGEHEASIILRLEKIKPEKSDTAQAYNEFDEFRRSISLKKNKQTGKHFKNIIGYKPEKRIFYNLEDKPKEVLDFNELREDIF